MILTCSFPICSPKAIHLHCLTQVIIGESFTKCFVTAYHSLPSSHFLKWFHQPPFFILTTSHGLNKFFLMNQGKFAYDSGNELSTSQWLKTTKLISYSLSFHIGKDAVTLVAVQLPQEWENINLGILYFCLKKKKSYFYSYFLGQLKLYCYTYFKSMKKWTLVMCPEWKKSEDYIHLK